MEPQGKSKALYLTLLFMYHAGGDGRTNNMDSFIHIVMERTEVEETAKTIIKKSN